MNYFNNKSNRWIILFLILLNVATLGFMWWNRPQMPLGPDRLQRPEGFLAKELGFSKEQANTLKVQMDDYFQKTDSIRNQLRQNRQELLDLISKDTYDSLAVNRQLIVNESLHTLENSLFIDHYRAVAKMCTAPQKQKLVKIFSRAMGPPPPRPRQEKGKPPVRQ